MKVSKTIIYVAPWIATGVAVSFAIKYTGNIDCLICFGFPLSANVFMMLLSAIF